MQGAQVQSLVRELDPTCHNSKILHAATKTWPSQMDKYLKEKKNNKQTKGGEDWGGTWRPQFTDAYFGNSALLQLDICFIPLFFQLKPANGIIFTKDIRWATDPVNTKVLIKHSPVSQLLKSLTNKAPLTWHLGFPCGSAGKESACSAGDLGLIPGLGRSPGEGKGYTLQYSGLENSMDCTVHGVTKSRTWLSDFHFTFTLHGI